MHSACQVQLLSFEKQLMCEAKSEAAQVHRKEDIGDVFASIIARVQRFETTDRVADLSPQEFVEALKFAKYATIHELLRLFRLSVQDLSILASLMQRFPDLKSTCVLTGVNLPIEPPRYADAIQSMSFNVSNPVPSHSRRCARAYAAAMRALIVESAKSAVHANGRNVVALADVERIIQQIENRVKRYECDLEAECGAGLATFRQRPAGRLVRIWRAIAT